MLFFIKFKILGCLCSFKENDISEIYCVQFKPEHIFEKELEMKILKSSIFMTFLERCNSMAFFYDQTKTIHTSERLFYIIKCIFERTLRHLNKHKQNDDVIKLICDMYFDVNSVKYKEMAHCFKTEVYNTINIKKYTICLDEQNSEVIFAFIEIIYTHIFDMAENNLFYEYMVNVNFNSIEMVITKEMAKANSNPTHTLFSVFCASYKEKEEKIPRKNVQIGKFVELKLCLQNFYFFEKHEIIFELHMHRTFLRILSSFFFNLDRESKILDFNQILAFVFEISLNYIKGLVANYKPQTISHNLYKKNITLKRATCDIESAGFTSFISKCNLDQKQILFSVTKNIEILITLLSMHAIVSFFNTQDDVSNRIFYFTMNLNFKCFRIVISAINENIIDGNLIKNTDCFLKTLETKIQSTNRATEQMLKNEIFYITSTTNLYIIIVCCAF